MKKTALTFMLSLLATPVVAQDLIVKFADGTATDRISFQSDGCNLSNAMVMIDLHGSAGGLIFDATADGDGAQRFAPVEITNGYGALSPVRDGDKRLQILVHTLPPGEALQLAAHLGGADAAVGFDGSNMAGASVRVALSDRVLKATFDHAGTAKIALPADANVCLAAMN